MGKFLLGILTGLGVGYVVYRLEKDGKLEGLIDDLSECGNKAKLSLKNFADVAKNEVEYVKDQAESKISKLKK